MSYSDDLIKMAKSKDPITAIWDIVKGFEYAIFDSRTQRKLQGPSYEDYQYMRIRTPEEVIETGYGTCWDQSMAITYLATKYRLKYKVLFDTDTKFNCHAICVIEHKNKYWYLESAWGNNKGKHGPYKSWDDAFIAYGSMMFDIEGVCFTYWNNKISYKKLYNNKNITMMDFYSFCGIDEERLEILQNPKGMLLNNVKDIHMDKFNRVTKIIYKDRTIEWDAFKGEEK